MTTAVPSLSGRLGRAVIDAFIDETVRGTRNGTASDLVVAGIAEHLEELIRLGIIRPNDSVPNRRINIVSSWNAMFGTGTESWMDPRRERERIATHVLRTIVWHNLHSIAWSIQRNGMDPTQREEATLRLEASMDAGTCDVLFAGEDSDFVSGERLSYLLSEWNLVVGRRTRDRNSPLSPIEDLLPATLQHLEIDVPSGRLLVAEWFHVPGFTDLVDEGNPWRGGSDAANEADAERYLRDHGFVSVSTARRSLSVFRRGDHIGIGHHDEDGDDPPPRGCRRVRDLTVDLRKVTIADRNAMLDVVRRIDPDADRERIVSEMERDRDVVAMDVSPGRYRVTSSGRGFIEDLLPADSRFSSRGFEAVVLIERIR